LRRHAFESDNAAHDPAASSFFDVASTNSQAAGDANRAARESCSGVLIRFVSDLSSVQCCVCKIPDWGLNMFYFSFIFILFFLFVPAGYDIPSKPSLAMQQWMRSSYIALDYSGHSSNHCGGNRCQPKKNILRFSSFCHYDFSRRGWHCICVGSNHLEFYRLIPSIPEKLGG